MVTIGVVGIDVVVVGRGRGAAWSVVTAPLNASDNAQHKMKHRRFHGQTTRIGHDRKLLGDGGDGLTVDVIISSTCGMFRLRQCQIKFSLS